MKRLKEPSFSGKAGDLSNWEEWALQSLNDSLEAANTFDTESLIKEISTLPEATREERIRELFFSYHSLINSLAVFAREGRRVPVCRQCGKFYIQKRRTQRQCPTCAKKLRDQKWRDAYEKEHGHPYRQTREPAFVKKVRKLLKAWPDFKPTKTNKRTLAADANIEVEQCEAALVIINERRGEK